MDIHELTGIEELEKQRLDPHVVDKKVKLSLDRLISGLPAHVLLSIFIKVATQSGWTDEEISNVVKPLQGVDARTVLDGLSTYCIAADPLLETMSIEEELNDIINGFEKDSWSSDDYEYDDDDGGCNWDDWDDVEDNSPCSYCARPDSDCESCPDRG